jgi:hypothetical protein
MPPVAAETTADAWDRLRIYRDRYEIGDRLEPVTSLERSMTRRRDRLTALQRRWTTLDSQLDELRSEIEAVESELEGSKRAGALLIDEILEAVANEHGQRWSPVPVRGFRVWRIEDAIVKGSQVDWPGPTMESRCLRSVPGEDIPHSVDRCGPPACGVYAVKRLDMFPADLTGGGIHRSVVGLVALTGKVVEHTDGYRGQRAEAVALAVNHVGRHWLVDEPDKIRELFEDPETAIRAHGSKRDLDPQRQHAFLGHAIEQETQWI